MNYEAMNTVPTSNGPELCCEKKKPGMVEKVGYLLDGLSKADAVASEAMNKLTATPAAFPDTGNINCIDDHLAACTIVLNHVCHTLNEILEVLGG